MNLGGGVMSKHWETKDAINQIKNDLGNLADDNFIKWLSDIDYFTMPAAKKHHGSYPSGLFNHSYLVAKTLKDFTERNNLKWDRNESPLIIGYLHDICKTDDYIAVGLTESGIEYDYNKNKIMPGHGDKSVIMLSGHFNLTEQEALCIEFHMGAFTDKDEWQYYSKAVSKDENVLWTHTADMLASQVLEIERR